MVHTIQVPALFQTEISDGSVLPSGVYGYHICVPNKRGVGSGGLLDEGQD